MGDKTYYRAATAGKLDIILELLAGHGNLGSGSSRRPAPAARRSRLAGGRPSRLPLALHVVGAGTRRALVVAPAPVVSH